jgi:hypothetical protein
VSSPYNDARAHSAPPPPRGVPGLAIVCNVPPAEAYKPSGAMPLIAILLPFRRLYEANGFMRNEIAIDKAPEYQCYVELKPLKAREEIYVNFGEWDPAIFVDENPKKKNEFQLKSAKFVDAVFTRFQSYTAPRPYDFCMKDEGFALSRDIVNMCAGEGPFRVMKKSTTNAKIAETVPTFYEKMWRRSASDNRWIEALLIQSPPISACYQTDEFEFSAPCLQPDPDDQTILTDNETYFNGINDFLGIRIRQMNALLCAIANYGDLSRLHPAYVDCVNEVRVEIGGHTDDMGTDAHNKVLSAQRAETLKKYLVDEMKTVLTYPSSVVKTFDATSGRLTAKGYAARECTTRKPTEDRTCRKISVRLVTAT